MSEKKVLLWGASSKARIIWHMLEDDNIDVVAVFDPVLSTPMFDIGRAKFGCAAEHLPGLIEMCSHFVVCIGGPHGLARVRTGQELANRNLKPLSVISKGAYVDKTAQIGVGFQAMPGSVVGPFTEIGDYAILNTNSSVDHESKIGDGVHIMGGAVLAGLVNVGRYTAVGTNATVMPNLTVGENSFVGAGALVNINVPSDQVVVGAPAKYLRPCTQTYVNSPFSAKKITERS